MTRISWLRWLKIALAITALFGLMLVLAPALTRALFGAILYGDIAAIDARYGVALPYIDLVHAVLGAVMAGWAALMFLVVRGPLARGEREAWWMLVVSIGVWFVPDTAYSLVSGHWQNALFNVAFLAMFVPPLLALRPTR